MKDIIQNMASGKFEYKRPELILSEEALSFEVEAGKEHRGSFILRNDRGMPFKGVLHSADRNLKIMQNQFEGKECEIFYCFFATDLLAGEKIKGTIQIISSCGEHELSYTVLVAAATCQSPIGKIKDLYNFANLAKDYPSQALKVFKSKDFEDVFLYRDATNSMLYHSLLKSTSTSQAMEEFLIAVHKKVRIKLDVNKNYLEYKNCEKKFMDQILITKDTWGYADIKIKSDAKFLIPEHKILWTDRFIGNSYLLEFIVDPENMHKGNNYGKIMIKTVHQMIVIEVKASLKKKEDRKEDTSQLRIGKWRITKNYLDFRIHRIDRKDYVQRMEKILEDHSGILEDSIAALIRAHLALVVNREKEVSEYLKKRDKRSKPLMGANLSDIVEYAGFLYIKSLLSKQREDINNAVEGIRYYYENGYSNWIVFWFLLNLDRKYDSNSFRIQAIIEHIEEGCHSPVLYYEAFQVYLSDPELLRELNHNTAAIMAWGIRKGLCTKKLALRFTYQAGRMKRFYPIIYRCLESIYQVFHLQDTLMSIISMLIRSEKMEYRFFKWYRMGIEKQLRITDIFEYYLYSINEEEDIVLPQSLLLYFMYDNNLNDRKKAFLFSWIIKNKEADPAAYRTHAMIIENFARRQIKAKVISPSLSVIYEEFLAKDKIDLEIAKALPEIMFQYEITCVNPNMIGVCVIHKEINEESYVPFVDQRAQIHIYTENFELLVVDRRGNRYVETMDYTLVKLLHIENLAMTCYDLSPENLKLLLYLYAKTESRYPINKDNVDLYRDSLRLLPLSVNYQRKNFNSLIQYYYDNAKGEYLEILLESLDLTLAGPSERGKWIGLCIIRNMYEKAMDYMKRYGFDGIDLFRLEQLCTYYIRSEKEEYSELLVHLCRHLFVKGQHSEPVLQYLILGFDGTTKEMLDVWKVAKGMVLDVAELEERLLVRILFTGCHVKEGIPAYESYVKKGGSRLLKKAYVSYLAYLNLIQDIEIPNSVYKKMKSEVTYEENRACMLALLKYFAGQAELTDKEKEFIDFNVSYFLEEGFILPFFQQFEDRIPLPAKLRDICLVDHIGNPDTNFTIHYQILGESKEQTRLMKNMYYGIFVSSFILFQDETLTYYITNDKKSVSTIVKEGTLKPPVKTVKNEDRIFDILNKILAAKEENNIKTMGQAMEEYLKRQCLLDKLFKPLEEVQER